MKIYTHKRRVRYIHIYILLFVIVITYEALCVSQRIRLHEILWWRWSRFSCTDVLIIIIEETRIPAATCTLNIIYWQSSIFPAETTGRSNNFETHNAQDKGRAAIYYAITSSTCVFVCARVHRVCLCKHKFWRVPISRFLLWTTPGRTVWKNKFQTTHSL